MRPNNLVTSRTDVAGYVIEAEDDGIFAELDQDAGYNTSVARVFITYHDADRRQAEHLHDLLVQSGIETFMDVWTLPGRQDWATMAEQAISASDFVVVLLSPTAMSSQAGPDVTFALSRELEQRGAQLIPVMTTPTDISRESRASTSIDLTEDFESGVQTLVKQIQTASQVDFSRMNPQSFEHLVADLLRAVGFEIHTEPRQEDRGVDMRATFQRTDPFGLPETESWLVQTKLYTHQRVSVKAIQQLASLVALTPSRTRGLLVTNTQLTSVARDYIAELDRRPDVRLRMLDGVQLKQLLRQFPHVIRRHFGDNAGVPA